MNPTAQKVLDFWFTPNNQTLWFAKNDDFDNQIRKQFFAIWQQAKAGECADWRILENGRNSQLGRLAEIIVLDQFSRNLARHTPDSFAQDGMALVLAQEGIKMPEFTDLSQSEKAFMLMPLMHAESIKIHEQALPLFIKYGTASNIDFEKRHKAIIEQFGRYPHRNAILGRNSTAEELAFLQTEGSSF